MGISARPAWRKATMVAGLLILVLLGGLAAAVLWQLARDPLAALPRSAGESDLLTVGRQRAAGREWRRVVLQIEGGGEVALQISLPDPLPARPLPVVMVLGGLGAGAESVRSMPAAGGNVLVGYDWPVPRRVPRELSALPTLLGIHRRLLLVPGEVSAALRWITAQPWADAERISLVGLSLGALAAPAVQRVAATQGVAIGWTVLGYGGAPLGALLTHHPRMRSTRLRPLLRVVADLLLRPLEPGEHLPHLKGEFLVLGGTEDVFVPEHAARRFADLTPAPKTVSWLEGAHLGVGADQDELLAEVIRRAAHWLRARGAVNATAL